MDAVDREFSMAYRRLPPPLECCEDGALCPWCGEPNSTVAFDWNECSDCRRRFVFGFPPWGSETGPLSWVPFPWGQFDALGGRADLLPPFEPNDRLKQIYFAEAERRLRVSASQNGTH